MSFARGMSSKSGFFGVGFADWNSGRLKSRPKVVAGE
jgi:hypothetical protein